MVRIQGHWSFVGDTLDYLRAHFNFFFFAIDCSLKKLTSKSDFSLFLWGIKYVFTPWRVNDRGSVSLGICRGHIRASKGAFQNFSAVDSSMVKLTSKSNFSLLCSFQVQFERVVNVRDCLCLLESASLAYKLVIRNTSSSDVCTFIAFLGSLWHFPLHCLRNWFVSVPSSHSSVVTASLKLDTLNEYFEPLIL